MPLSSFFSQSKFLFQWDSGLLRLSAQCVCSVIDTYAYLLLTLNFAEGPCTMQSLKFFIYRLFSKQFLNTISGSSSCGVIYNCRYPIEYWMCLNVLQSLVNYFCILHMFYLFVRRKIHIQKTEKGTHLNNHYCIVLRIPFLHWVIIFYNTFPLKRFLS